MCLAIPGKIIEINNDEHSAIIDFDGIQQKVIVALVPGAKVGKYAIVHAGYAIELMNEKEAREAIDQWDEMSEELGLDLNDVI
ncbi:MAG: HypC/HybG/HupF family hydrogenase formation chaperone [Candidatus Lokiarchaeota archaeon]|nr:HypC/HybG/HupF family hydrogenase formation chaperone [Candidatus Lokiarchaeota archaeon]MBD3199800.1 HypC/HybG/HupF family hydrogenase formation chaperone [Candidatus Lokiarchaeota archaeon]